ncbi:MAG: archaeosortase/exosortase family protein [Terricaulis sp.]|nr:archaeosortase/exosortase family protein [Terricaulis sp.]
MTSPHLTAPASGAWRDFARAGAILILLLLQCAALDRGYSYIHAVSGPDAALWAEANTLLKWLVYGAVFGGVAFALSALASGRNFAKLWRESVERHLWGRWLAAEAACFAALYAMLPLFQRGAESPPWLAFAVLLALGALMFACAALALAPLRFWRAFASQRASAYWVSAGIGLLTFAALPLSQNSWTALSSATLHLSYWFLQLYEPAARMEADRFLLGAGDFAVLVRAACSGYEGIALVLGMMGAYIYAFRAHLRFPHVLLLLPIGVAAIWIFNALRIALLVSIGARISPQLALDGFHAQAGWVLFPCGDDFADGCRASGALLPQRCAGARRGARSCAQTRRGAAGAVCGLDGRAHRRGDHAGSVDRRDADRAACAGYFSLSRRDQTRTGPH